MFRARTFFWQNILGQALLAPILSLVYTASNDLIDNGRLQPDFQKRVWKIYAEDWKYWPVVNGFGMYGQRIFGSQMFALRVSQAFCYLFWIPHRRKTYKNGLVQKI
jgi:hypothetical protein